MKTLNVNIEINGVMTTVGRITGLDSSDAVFCYDSDYLRSDGVRPISCSLPLSENPFSATETKNYFEGLLPEGFSRKAVSNWIKADENDYIRILEQLGKECLGAISIGDYDTGMMGAYIMLEKNEIKELAAEGATQSTKLLVETHLSLTGASGKVGLYRDLENDRWFLPTGNMPSTHIIKQSHVRLSKIVLNELICLITARNLGIKVSNSFIINQGEGGDADVLFATERYDRYFSPKTINGLKIPYRLHQEDFAQAMGIPASLKYEIEKKNYLGKMFRLVSKVSSNPIRDQLALWDIIVFNYLIGNTDCHIKNYSLLYDANLKNISLAPAYDIVCTQIYGTKKEMSLFIGDNLQIDKITMNDFEMAASEAGLGKKIAMDHLNTFANGLESALKKAVEELIELGFPAADNLGKEILEKCGMNYLKSR